MRASRHSILVAVVLFVTIAGFVTPAEAQPDRPRPAAPWGTGRSAPEDLQIEFVAFGPGESVASWFGHAAIVVEDRKRGARRLYNYGMFQFDGTLLVKFALGRLWFWVGAQPPERTYRFYKSMGRAVRIHTLNLPPEKRMQVARFLEWNVKPEHREYLYHHYRDNCATRPRDILNAAVSGALRRAASDPSPLTLREHTRRYTHHNFFMDLLLMFMMNDSIDQPIEEWHAMFLPGELEEGVLSVTYPKPSGEEVSFVSDSRTYHEGEIREIPDRAPAHWPWALLLGSLIGGGALGFASWRLRAPDSTAARIGYGLHQALVGIAAGLPGVGLFLMSIGTDHTVTYWNENILFANPLTFAVLPLGILYAWGERWTLDWLRAVWAGLVGTSVLGLLLKVLPAFDQQNRLPVSLLLPITVGCAAAAWWLWRAESREVGDSTAG